jgi:hypothetical protein
VFGPYQSSPTSGLGRVKGDNVASGFEGLTIGQRMGVSADGTLILADKLASLVSTESFAAQPFISGRSVTGRGSLAGDAGDLSESAIAGVLAIL